MQKALSGRFGGWSEGENMSTKISNGGTGQQRNDLRVNFNTIVKGLAPKDI
jgi:hypothetical protein